MLDGKITSMSLCGNSIKYTSSRYSIPSISSFLGGFSLFVVRKSNTSASSISIFTVSSMLFMLNFVCSLFSFVTPSTVNSFVLFVFVFNSSLSVSFLLITALFDPPSQRAYVCCLCCPLHISIGIISLFDPFSVFVLPSHACSVCLLVLGVAGGIAGGMFGMMMFGPVSRSCSFMSCNALTWLFPHFRQLYLNVHTSAVCFLPHFVHRFVLSKNVFFSFLLRFENCGHASIQWPCLQYPQNGIGFPFWSVVSPGLTFAIGCGFGVVVVVGMW